MRTFADGQLAASATALFTAGQDSLNFPSAGNLQACVTLQNTGASQTITLTFMRQGGTSRRIARVVLGSNETAVISGIPMQTGDTILGVSTNATTVDYIVGEESGGVGYSISCYDANGQFKQVNGTSITGATTITATSSNALAVGQGGATNPAFNVDSSTASSATGLNVKSAAAGGGVALSVISSGSPESMTIDAKAAGTITLNGTATGNVIIGSNLQITDAKNIVLATTTGTQIGTGTTQKIGFYGLTAIVQPTASTNSTTGTTGASTGISIDTTLTGGSGASAYTVGGVILRLKQLGLLAA